MPDRPYFIIEGKATQLRSIIVYIEVTVVGSRCGPFAPALEALAQKKINVRSLITEVFPLKS